MKDPTLQLSWQEIHVLRDLDTHQELLPSIPHRKIDLSSFVFMPLSRKGSLLVTFHTLY